MKIIIYSCLLTSYTD